MMKKTILAFLAFLAIPFSPVQAQDFTVDFDTATLQVEEDVIVLDGIRVDGFGFIVENDALKVRFVFNPQTLNFELDAESIVYYTGIGVFHEELLVAGDSLPQPIYTTADGEVVEVGIQKANELSDFTATAEAPFVATFDLQTGHVMSWYFNIRTKDIVYQLTGPDTNVEKTIPAREKVWTPPIKILTPGTYTLTVLPLNPEDTATFQFDAFNLNNRIMTVLADGDKLKESFTHTGEYAKFQVTLNQGDTLEVPATKNENIAMKLVDKTSHVVVNAENGSALTYQHSALNNRQKEETADYYLFIYLQNESKGSYSGKISITAEKKNTSKPNNNKPNNNKPNNNKPNNNKPNNNQGSENTSGNETSDNGVTDDTSDTGDADTEDSDTGDADTEDSDSDTGDTDTGETSDTGDSDTGDTSDTEDSDTEDSDTEDADTGDADTGDSDTEDSDTGDSDTEDSDTGDSDTEDSDTGDSDTEDSDTEDSDTGDSDTEDSDTGDTDTGESSDTGDTDTGESSDTGDTDTGESSDTGDTDTGESSDTGDTDTGDSDTGDTDTGDSDTGSTDEESGSENSENTRDNPEISETDSNSIGNPEDFFNLLGEQLNN
jgi:hypothetical protein